MPKQKFKRISQGKHHAMIDGKRLVIRRGDIVECEANELTGFLKDYECLDPLPPDKGANPLTIKHTGNGRYNVIHAKTGEAINDHPLTKEEAEAILNENVTTTT